jgi:hypothetical protein
MDTRILVAVIVIAVILIAAAVLILRKRRSDQLRQQFGPEYDRAVKQHGDTRRAEAALAEREKRVESFSIRELPAPERERFAQEWAAVQRRFVDDPAVAVTEADRLVTQVMAARGYPMGDFEQRAADISVHHPAVVENYRAARTIAVRHSSGQSNTEELRRAMVYYRSLFEDLLGATTTTTKTGVMHERAS